MSKCTCNVDDEGYERSEERSKSVNPKAKQGAKKGNDGLTDRTLKTEKSQDKLKINAKNDLYPDNGADTNSLEREYNRDNYLKKESNLIRRLRKDAHMILHQNIPHAFLCHEDLKHYKLFIKEACDLISELINVANNQN
ncbi:MAG: hypothetical protein EOP04_29880 [Proteobacteria bacterium]|nr:MAG: hypothetical protein EOP04_29880 [Pseudomonadota bacterium]